MQLLVALRAHRHRRQGFSNAANGVQLRYEHALFGLLQRGGRDVERRYILRTTRKDYEDLDANGMPTSFCDEVVEADNSTGRFYEVEGETTYLTIQ